MQLYIFINILQIILSFHINLIQLKMHRKNKQQSNSKNNNKKLKTLPNQIITNQNQHHFFQSACQEQINHPIKVNLASPTFATEIALTSISGQFQDHNDQISRSDNCLRQITNFSNKQNTRNMDFMAHNQTLSNRSNLTKRLFNTNSNSIEPHNQQSYQRLLLKCQQFQSHNQTLQQENRILNNKIKACKKALQTKLQQALKWKQAPNNSSENMSNIDCFLEVKSFRDDFKKITKKNIQLEHKNKQALGKINELEQAMTNFTEKDEQMLKKERQNIDKVTKKYKSQIDQMKNQYEDRVKSEKLKVQEIQKKWKKSKKDYQQLKFLKDQIEKKRQQEIQLREDFMIKLTSAQQKCQQMQINNLQLRKQVETIYKQYQEYKNQQTQLSHHQQLQAGQLTKLKLQLAKLQPQYDQLHKLFSNLQQQNKQLENQCKQLENKIHNQDSPLAKQNCELKVENQSLKANQECLNKKIQALQKQVNITAQQCEQIKVRFNEFISESQHKTQEQKQVYKRQHEQKMKELDKMIKQLEKSKQQLQAQLASQKNLSEKYKQDFQKASQQLENSYRKMQEIQTDKFSKKQINNRANYSYDHILNKNTSLPTKSISQLEMIKNILSLILNLKKKNSDNEYINEPAEHLISEIVYLAEQCADYFDQMIYTANKDRQTIKTKEEIISKILKFAPEQEKKKRKILQYLRIMDNLEDFTVQQINRVNIQLRQEWEQWNIRIKHWKKALDQLQEQNTHLRKLLRGTSGARRGYLDDAPRNRGNDKEKRDNWNERYIMQ